MKGVKAVTLTRRPASNKIIASLVGRCSARMGQCYREETLHFTDVMFPGIPVSYLLTMEGSRRRQRYMSQLRQHRPTSMVVIVHNLGHCRCAKPRWVADTVDDVRHASIHIMEAARERCGAGGHVLIMEDDVEFTADARASRHADEFMRRVGADAYFLGVVPFLSRAHGRHHLRVYNGGGSHAVIYAASALPRAVDVLLSCTMNQPDVELCRRLRSFAPRLPAAVQRLEQTANSSNWRLVGLRVNAGGVVTRVLAALTRADVHPTPWFYMLHALGVAGGLVCVLVLAVAAVVATLAARRRRHRAQAHTGPLT